MRCFVRERDRRLERPRLIQVFPFLLLFFFKLLEILLSRGRSSSPEESWATEISGMDTLQRRGGVSSSISLCTELPATHRLGNTIKAAATTFRLATHTDPSSPPSFKYSELIPFALFVPTLFALPSCILIIPLPRLLNPVGFSSMEGKNKRRYSYSSSSILPFFAKVFDLFPRS